MIHTKNASSLSFEQLYRNSYNIVLMTRGNDLYDKVKELEQEWLDTDVQKRVTAAIVPGLLVEKETADVGDQANEKRAAGEKFLVALKEAWEDHQLCMSMITDVLMYMVSLHSAMNDCLGWEELTSFLIDRTEWFPQIKDGPPYTLQPWLCSAILSSELKSDRI